MAWYLAVFVKSRMPKRAKQKARNSPLTITTAEAAARLSVSRMTVLRLLKTGRLKGVLVGEGKKRKHLRISVADLEAFVASPTKPTPYVPVYIK